MKNYFWACFLCVSLYVHCGKAQDTDDDDDNSQMSLIGLALEAFNPCPDGFIFMEREIGRRPSEENYWDGSFRFDKYKNLSEARIELRLDNPAVVTVDSEVARVYSEGNVFRIFPFEVKDSIPFVVKAGQGKPFPNVAGAKLNGKTVCRNPSKWNPTILGVQAVALGSVTPAPTNFIPWCGRRQIERAELIVRGKGSKYGDWPWHIAMYIKERPSQNLTYICGGTLISSNTIVTAAHCVTLNGVPRDPLSIVVAMGKYKKSTSESTTQERPVANIIVHSGFSFRTLRNDIAIVKFRDSVEYSEYVQPICLWPANEKDKGAVFGTEGSVVGWGITENETLSEELRVGNMSIVSDTECLLSYASFFGKYVYENSLCAGRGLNGGPSACNGDSGGGLVIPRIQPDGKYSYFLRGVVSLSVSLATGICDSTHYAVFTDTAQYLDWINENR